MKETTHDDLVESAARWLRKEHCIVITEMAGGGDNITEKPDAIGWRMGSKTTLIECKASRSDFLSDKKKPSRQSLGMGTLKYYLAPKGIINSSELPEKWGLLEYQNGRSHPKIIRYPMSQYTKNWHAEMGILCSALRRRGGLRKEGVSVKIYQFETKNTATLGVGIEGKEEKEEEVQCPACGRWISIKATGCVCQLEEEGKYWMI